MAFLLIFPYIFFYNRNKSVSLTLLFGFITNIFFLLEGNQNFFGFTYQITDLGIFSLIYSIIYEKLVNGAKIFEDSPTNYKILLLFFLILIIVDITIFSTSISSLLTTRRILLYILIFSYFNCFNKTELEQTLSNLISITKISYPIYFLQFIINEQIFYGNTVEHEFVLGMTRFANFPPFTLPFLFYLFFNNVYKNRFLWISISSAAILLSTSRSLVIGIALALLLYNITNLKNILKTSVILSIIALFFLASLRIIPGFQARMEDGFKEVTYVIENISSGNIESRGTFSYRMAFLIERLDYLSKDITNIMFGIGGISEQNLQRSLFDIGIIDETTGLTQQLNTGDNAWVLLFLRFGLLGSLIYIITILFQLFYNYFKLQSSLYKHIGLSYLIFLFLRSVVTSDLATMQVFFVPLLFYYLGKYTYNNLDAR
ncbi:MAG: hypothetical protein M5R37_15100 [Melioribacteraceae bacterium]|nr:hypothetical protein [Melioribacteraceae bacterium]